MAEIATSPHKGGISTDVRKVANLARAGVLYPWELDHLLNALDAAAASCQSWCVVEGDHAVCDGGTAQEDYAL